MGEARAVVGGRLCSGSAMDPITQVPRRRPKMRDPAAGKAMLCRENVLAMLWSEGAQAAAARACTWGG